MKDGPRTGIQSIRTFIGDDGAKIRTFIDAPDITKHHLDNAVKMMSATITSIGRRILFLGGNLNFIKKVVNEALERLYTAEEQSVADEQRPKMQK